MALFPLLAATALVAHAAAPPVEVTIYVSQASGADDDNDGSRTAPLRSLSEALDRAVGNRRAGSATRIAIGAGTYRESLIGSYQDFSGPRITFEAEEPGKVIVSGAERWTEWSCEGSACRSDWPYDWGTARNPWPEQVDVHPMARRRELVLVDGKLLDQVAGPEDLVPGSFAVDEVRGVLHVMPPEGVDLEDADVEVGVRGTLVRLQGLHDITFSGITFTAAASAFRGAAVDIVDQRSVLLKDIRVVNNGQVGVALKGHDLEVGGSELSWNGSSGITAFQVKGARLSETRVEGNNWRGYRYGYYSWEVGNKFSSVHDIYINRLMSIGNLSRGIWFDVDVVNVHIFDSVFCGNVRDGVFFEGVRGPVRLENSTVCLNGEYGVLTSTSQYLEIVNNRVHDNAYAQLGISGDLRRTIRDWTSGELYDVASRSWTVVDNELAATGDQLLIDTSLPLEVWETLMRTSSFAGNAYRHESSGRPFEVPGSRSVQFAAWVDLTGEDDSSIFEGPDR